MNLKQGCSLRNIDMEGLKRGLMEHGFELKEEE